MPKPTRKTALEGHTMKETSYFWFGIDWHDNSHTVHVFQPSTNRHERFTVPHSAQGLETLVQRITAVGTVGGIAVEATRNLLVVKLVQAGLPVYAVNPKISKDWRSSYSVAGAKSDAGDARVLAEGVWHHHEHLRTSSLPSASMQELTQLCEDEKHFIDQRTAWVQELQAVLKQYHPQALRFFDDWTAPTAWDFVATFATPEALAKATKARLCRFLAARHIGMSPRWQQRIDQRSQALEWPQDPGTVAALALRVKTLVTALKALEKQLREYRKRIETLFATREEAQVFSSLPGAGAKLAPRLCTIFGENHSEYDSADTVRQLGGVSPVTKDSGKKKEVFMRRACRKKWRNTLHLFAQLSKARCLWAKAYYRLCRDRGDNHATALRKLAYKWLAIIYRMWQTQSTYDEQRHLEQLKKKDSPTYHYMLANGYLA